MEFFNQVIGLVDTYWEMLLRGTGMTLLISLTGTVAGFIIGLLVGVVRTIPKRGNPIKKAFLSVINVILSIYIEVFRGTPMMVQAMVIFYGYAYMTQSSLNPVFAGILIVSINTGAYMAEIVRGGIISVDSGQFEAAQAIGMGHGKTMLYIVLPQVIRNILPATGNEFVINIKDTSVLNVISISELFFQTRSITSTNLMYFQSFLVTCVIYLILTFTITRLLRLLEKKLDGPKNFSLSVGGNGNLIPVKGGEQNG